MPKNNIDKIMYNPLADGSLLALESAISNDCNIAKSQKPLFYMVTEASENVKFDLKQKIKDLIKKFTTWISTLITNANEAVTKITNKIIAGGFDKGLAIWEKNSAVFVMPKKVMFMLRSGVNNTNFSRYLDDIINLARADGSVSNINDIVSEFNEEADAFEKSFDAKISDGSDEKVPASEFRKILKNFNEGVKDYTTQTKKASSEFRKMIKKLERSDEENIDDRISALRGAQTIIARSTSIFLKQMRAALRALLSADYQWATPDKPDKDLKMQFKKGHRVGPKSI